MSAVLEIAPGVLHYPERLDRPAQEALRAAIDEVLAAAPPFVPRMPRTGKPFSVRMTNCGPLGWVSDERGYRYQPSHPQSGAPWPPMPEAVLELWAALAPGAPPPEACLVNLYDSDARMALHQDRDEAELSAPVVSLSLGDTALFRVGGRHARRADALLPPRLGRRGDPRRPGAARLSRRRPHLSGNLDAAAGRRADQSDDAAGDEGVSSEVPALGRRWSNGRIRPEADDCNRANKARNPHVMEIHAPYGPRAYCALRRPKRRRASTFDIGAYAASSLGFEDGCSTATSIRVVGRISRSNHLR